MDLSKFKFTVFLDVDDIIFDFHKYFAQHLREKHGVQVGDKFLPQNYDYSDVVPNFAEIFAALPVDWPARLELISGAKSMVDTLRALGGRIIMLTSLANNQVPFRLKALRETGVHFDEIYFTWGQPKSAFINQLLERAPGPLLFVDDALKNCNDVFENTPVKEALCYRTPYNRIHLKAGNDIHIADCMYCIQDETLRRAAALIGAEIPFQELFTPIHEDENEEEY
jgi:hypothetical protein